MKRRASYVGGWFRPCAPWDEQLWVHRSYELDPELQGVSRRARLMLFYEAALGADNVMRKYMARTMIMPPEFPPKLEYVPPLRPETATLE